MKRRKLDQLCKRSDQEILTTFCDLSPAADRNDYNLLFIDHGGNFRHIPQNEAELYSELHQMLLDPDKGDWAIQMEISPARRALLGQEREAFREAHNKYLRSLELLQRPGAAFDVANSLFKRLRKPEPNSPAFKTAQKKLATGKRRNGPANK